jgi:predicted transcriptional regulator
MNMIIINTILTQNSIKLLFKTNIIKKTRQKNEKNNRKRYKFVYKHVLIETMIKKHKKNEIK